MLKMMKPILMITALCLSIAVDAQDRSRDAQPTDRGRDAGRTAADRPKPKPGPDAEASAKALANAYTLILFLNEKENKRIYDALMKAEEDLIAARQRLANAQREIDESMKKQLNLLDQSFTEEQRAKLRMARAGSGEWNQIVDPRGCNEKKAGSSALRPAPARPSGDGTTPTRPTEGRPAPSRPGGGR